MTVGTPLSTPTSSKRPISNGPVRISTEFYFQDGDITLRAEDTLFRIHLSVLHENSPVLRNSIMPQHTAVQSGFRGFDDRRPFELHKVKAEAFTNLLEVLTARSASALRALSINDWISVLDLANRWQMEEVLTCAGRHLHALRIDPVRKIVIWEKYRLPKTLLAGSYVELCLHPEPLSLAVALALGIREFTRLAMARDKFHQRIGCLRCRSLSESSKEVIALDVVKEIFLTEVKPEGLPTR